MVMLVLLRLNIGWHFFSEGVKHYSDPNWSSEPVLRAATGPLAPMFQSYLPEHRALQKLQAKPENGKPVGDAWLKEVHEDWTADARRFADFYQLDEQQRAAVDEALERRRLELAGWKLSHQDDLDAYHFDRSSLMEAAALPTAETIPFQKKRIDDSAARLGADARGWFAEIKQIETEFHRQLDRLLTVEQRSKGSTPREKSPLQMVDKVMTFGILGIGVCLVLGLFTRLACLLGAAFLLSVVLTQPFWVSDAQPTFNQWVELLALLALATTNVGKWGGLDFFIRCLLGGCCRGKCDPENPKP